MLSQEITLGKIQKMLEVVRQWQSYGNEFTLLEIIFLEDVELNEFLNWFGSPTAIFQISADQFKEVEQLYVGDLRPREMANLLGAKNPSFGIAWTWATDFLCPSFGRFFVKWAEQNGYETRGYSKAYPEHSNPHCQVDGVRYRR